MYQINALFLNIGHLLRSGRGPFLALSVAGHARGPPVHCAKGWAPGGLRGGRSGRSKSRELGSYHGITFHRARASQDDGKPMFQLFCSTLSHTGTKLASSFSRAYNHAHYYACVDHDYACGNIAYACGWRKMLVRVCAGLCMCVLESHISYF